MLISYFSGNLGEAEVFKAALKWIVHDLASRGQYVLDILQAVRLSRIPYELLDGLLQPYLNINSIGNYIGKNLLHRLCQSSIHFNHKQQYFT